MFEGTGTSPPLREAPRENLFCLHWGLPEPTLDHSFAALVVVVVVVWWVAGWLADWLAVLVVVLLPTAV